MNCLRKLGTLRRTVGDPTLLAGATLLALTGFATTTAALGNVLGTPNQHMWTLGASETAVSIWDGNRNLTMTFNADDLFGFVSFANNTRTIYSGAGGAGFTTYNSDSKAITYTNAPNVFRPPSGWSVLWGDPSIVRNKADVNKLYIAQLGVPTSKFPSSGKIVGSLDDNSTCGILGGACIARSTDSGQTFTISSADCLKHTTTTCPNGTFYDGSDMTTSPEGRVYAAFNDVSRSRIDVWMATNSTGAFSRLPDIGLASGLHPRLRYGSDGALYVLFEDAFNELVIARYTAGSSYTGTWTTHVVEGSSGVYNGGDDVLMSDRAIRLGPEYDFDVGLGDDGTNQIRVAFILKNSSGKHYLKAVRCTMASSMTCYQPGVWNTATTTGDQWGPAIAFGFHVSTGKPAWYLSYYTRQGNANGNTVELWGGEITNPPGLSTFSTFRLEAAQTACPDIRDLSHPATAGGYWGDYDRMGTPGLGYMWRGFTDSSHGTCQRQMFHSSPNYTALTMWSFQ